MNPELVDYMRGDKASRSVEDHGAIQHYIHTYYNDIEDLYLDRIFKRDIQNLSILLPKYSRKQFLRIQQTRSRSHLAIFRSLHADLDRKPALPL